MFVCLFVLHFDNLNLLQSVCFVGWSHYRLLCDNTWKYHNKPLICASNSMFGELNVIRTEFYRCCAFRFQVWHIRQCVSIEPFQNVLIVKWYTHLKQSTHSHRTSDLCVLLLWSIVYMANYYWRTKLWFSLLLCLSLTLTLTNDLENIVFKWAQFK